MTVLFDDDDEQFLRWTADNPNGFVANMRRRYDPSYVVLHRASCSRLTRRASPETSPGGFTERFFIKVCSETVADLDSFIAGQWKMDSPVFSKKCSFCDLM